MRSIRAAAGDAELRDARRFDDTPIGTSQRISVNEALELHTVGSAVASGEASTKGRLAPGYLADFVVLDRDPLTTNPSDLSGIQVRATWVGGLQVWP